ncbi:biotin transporter BioY [Pseudogracilibacillus sp. SE30717A]|uniref:biotin transporter BioY n=1 Tax=Pseudogracilibacillus sp. SE30717A TaxID=3098293 RepID=UPI00300DC65D
MRNSKLQMMNITALFAAIIGVLAQVTIPLPLVPITGQTLAIGLAATILGSRYGSLSSVLYLIIGAIGIPVFSQMSAGLGVIFGPTGGFIIGFIPTAYIIGIYLEKTKFTVINAFIANIIGMFITLIIGTVWLKFIANLTWPAAFMAGFIPFIVGGLIKAFLAAWIGILVRQRLQSANIIYTQTERAS